MDNAQLLIGLVLIGGAVFLILYAVLSQVNEKSVVRGSLRQLEGYEVENVRDQELLAPITERAVTPVLGGLTSLVRRVTPTGYVDNVRKKYIQAGDGSADTIDRFLAVRVITVAALIPITWVVWFWNPIGVTGMLQWL